MNEVTAWRAKRAERKARAAETVKANAKAAQAAKRKALAKGAAFDDGGITKKAKQYEDRANARAKAAAESKEA